MGMKGPWQRHYHQVVDADGDEVARRPPHMSDEEWEPYARFIADGPEMLELLRTLGDFEHRWGCSDGWCHELLPKLYALLARHDPQPVTCPVCRQEYEPDPRGKARTQDGEPYVCATCAIKALRQYRRIE